MCQESIKGTVSYNDLAAKISSELDCNSSRQAFFYRTKEEATEFFKQILASIMKQKHLNDVSKINTTIKFKRILVQDSTIIHLPNKLLELFSGVNNISSRSCNARIQGIYDLLSGNFISFSIDPYSKNDLKAAFDIDVQEGDLVIRDRGYFVIACIEKLKSLGADSLMRYKHKTKFYDPITHKEINLLSLLKLSGKLDISVLTDLKKKCKLRILAVPVTEEVANLRRMKAKQEHKVCLEEFLQLLGWTIFITTIDDPNLTVEQACILYSLRWRIECIFKTWKSNFSFNKIHNVSHLQLRVLLYARFITITAFYHRLFVPLEKIVLVQSNKMLSLMKFMRFISQNPKNFIKQYLNANTSGSAIQKIINYCTFDLRKRTNFNQILGHACVLNEL